MEDTLAYQAWIDKFNEWNAVCKQKAINKREDRRMRNLTNKANGGFQERAFEAYKTCPIDGTGHVGEPCGDLL
jgi:hypothetical protein